MKPKEVAQIAKVSPNTVYKKKQGRVQSYNPETVNLVLGLLDFHNEYLKDIFLEQAFIEICETAIAKSRKPDIREFAALCKHASLALKSAHYKKTKPENSKNDMPEVQE